MTNSNYVFNLRFKSRRLTIEALLTVEKSSYMFQEEVLTLIQQLCTGLHGFHYTVSPKIGCNLNLREQMSFTEQCIRHQLLKYVKLNQCLTLHPTPPVPMFTMSNQDSDSKEPFKHPTVGFCSLTWYREKASPLLKGQYFETELFVHVLSG